ncbi:MAG: FAD-binding protein [Hyphomicrobiaceae bacterium]|nr:FAD-binding protein [Hyphomicrobiaceae bacterium]
MGNGGSRRAPRSPRHGDLPCVDADVVAVGGGGAGLAAASSAAALGRRVVLIEKAGRLGGTTAWSVGSVTAINTPHQRRAGIADSADEHFEDLGLLAGGNAKRDNLALRRLLVENTTQMFDWLLSVGLVFAGPSPEPPHRRPRMHNVLPNSRAFPAVLGRHCRRRGVDIYTGLRARRLLLDGGRVCGVVAEAGDGAGLAFVASSGVVLATGDFSAEPEMKANFASPAAAKTPAVNGGSTGDGHKLAMALGAQIVNGDIVHGPRLRFVPPARTSLVRRVPPWRIVGWVARMAAETLPDALRPVLMGFVTTALGVEANLYRQGAILVNALGRRFADELAAPKDHLPHEPRATAYAILDGAIAETFSRWPNFVSTAPGIAYAYIADYRYNRRDIFHEAPSLEKLGSLIGVPGDALAETVAASNTAASACGRSPLTRPPFIALGPIKPYVVFTDGGLRVTERLEVVGGDGRPIPGLYAAGSVGQGGLLLYGHGHHLAWAFISGRIAGRHAALAERGHDRRAREATYVPSKHVQA